MTVLATARLALRDLTPDDVDLLVALDSDPEVMWHLTKGAPSTREEVAARVRRSVAGRATHPGYGMWVGAARDTGAFVGWFALQPADDMPADEPMLGYRLRRAAWGRGYATEGSKALVGHAFAELGARRVWAETMAVNVRSRRVMQRLGMRHAGTWFGEWDDPIPGWEQGEVVYEVTREEWASRRPMD